MSEPRRIAFIGLERNEVPAFACWRHDMQSMMETMFGLLFVKSCERAACFMIAMDYICGIRASEYLHHMKGWGEEWDEAAIELHTLFGLGGQRAMWLDKRKYYDLRTKYPERRYTDAQKRDAYLLGHCDELILMANGKSKYKDSLISQCIATNIELTVISPNPPVIGGRMFKNNGKSRTTIWTE